MKLSENIILTINRLPNGYVFTYSDFRIEVDQFDSLVKALNRMEAAGKIMKLSKGKYYKPERSPFGNLQPNQAQVVKDLLKVDGKITGYLTGLSVYNQLGLTTQVSNTIQIGKNNVRHSFKRDRYNISFIKQKNTITKENISLLQILDSLRYIKKIPDTTIEMACKRFLAIIKNLSETEINSLIRLAMKYPPSTRALLGAFLNQLQKSNSTDLLLRSLNPITKYKLTGASKVLSNTLKWNIV